MADYAHAAGGISLSQAHTSDDDSSDHSPPLASSSKSSIIIKKTKNTRHHQMMIDSSTPENATRKPRGRPPGSKNKPKPPVVITRDSDSAMKPVILEISAGADIIENIVIFARKNHVGISLISASGSVSHVTLRQPISHSHSLPLHGPFHLLSLTGSFFLDPSSSSPCSTFGATLAGAQGQVFGGIVAGKVTAESLVVVVAATFLNPAIHSLPLSNDRDNHQDHQVDHHQQETKINTGTGETTESCSSMGKSMSVYGVANATHVSCQIPPDHHVMHWGPPSRPPY